MEIINRRTAVGVVVAAVIVIAAILMIGLVLRSEGSAKNLSKTSSSSVLLPTYLPSGAKLWQTTSQKGSAGVLYKLPGLPPISSPTYPFRTISIAEYPVAEVAGTFPKMSFTTNAKESLKTGFTIDGGRARLYSSTSINGWNQLEWIANGIETSIGTCSSCGVSVSQH